MQRTHGITLLVLFALTGFACEKPPGALSDHALRVFETECDYCRNYKVEGGKKVEITAAHQKEGFKQVWDIEVSFQRHGKLGWLEQHAVVTVGLTASGEPVHIKTQGFKP